jgi:hypothetical protein
MVQQCDLSQGAVGKVTNQLKSESGELCVRLIDERGKAFGKKLDE